MPWNTLIPQLGSLAEETPSSATAAASTAAVLVPTVDTVRTEYLVDVLGRRAGRPVMLIGDHGSAKSLVVQQYLSKTMTGDCRHLSKTIVFSSVTTSTALQVRVRLLTLTV